MGLCAGAACVLDNPTPPREFNTSPALTLENRTWGSSSSRCPRFTPAEESELCEALDPPGESAAPAGRLCGRKAACWERAVEEADGAASCEESVRDAPPWDAPPPCVEAEGGGGDREVPLANCVQNATRSVATRSLSPCADLGLPRGSRALPPSPMTSSARDGSGGAVASGKESVCSSSPSALVPPDSASSSTVSSFGCRRLPPFKEPVGEPVGERLSRSSVTATAAVLESREALAPGRASLAALFPERSPRRFAPL